MLPALIVRYSLFAPMPEQRIGPEPESRRGLSLVRFERVHSPAPLSAIPLLIIATTAFAVVAPFFFFGIPSGHDFEFHLNSWMEVLSQWKMGILYPRWADLAYYGYGEPRFIFYPPLSWMLGAALGAVLPWPLAVSAYIWLVLSLSGCAMFLLARNWLNRRDALFAAAFYAANPYHLVIVYWRSAFAELLAGALFPLLLLAVLRLQEKGRTWIAPLAVILAAIWLTNAPSAVMANYSLALLVILMAAARRSPRILWQAAIAVCLGLGLAAFYVLPATYEQRWVNIFQVLSPGVRPVDNFLFTTLADTVHNQFNRLISVVAVAEMLVLAISAFCWRRWQRLMPRSWWLIAAWGAAAALVMFPVSSLLWSYLPKLRFMQLPWRWLLTFNVAFAVLVAAAWRRWLPRLLLAGGMLATLFLAGRYFQPPWWDQVLDIAEMQENIRTGIGYEGTDEYTPTGADNYQVRPGAPRAFLEDGQLQVQRWTSESKSLSATISSPRSLVLRLFRYPAWQAEVNGHSVAVEARRGTGQVIIPLVAGENHVQLKFARTWDRTAGGFSALAAALMLGGLYRFTGRPARKEAKG